MSRMPLLLAGAAALALAGCGKVGTLERPAPMWGAEAKAKWEAEQKAAAEAKARADHPPQTGPEPLPPMTPQGHSETVSGSPADIPPPPPTPQ
jgi:hypothetical protein